MRDMRTIATALIARNDSILSICVRRANGKSLLDLGDHRSHWRPIVDDVSTEGQVEVPILQGKQRWGSLEICFKPRTGVGWFSWSANPALRFVVFVGGAAMLLFNLYLKRVLQHLDPASVIPDRVRHTLDTLAEGVLVLDASQRIVLANKSFAEKVGKDAADLQGTRASSIEFADSEQGTTPSELPWVRALQNGERQTGVMLKLHSTNDGTRTFAVNSAPILGRDGVKRGALATFDDVTSVEAKNLRLEQMLQVLNASREEIRRQNQELVVLATRDPLTSCLNRRAFFNEFETLWQAARDNGLSLSCLMLDIDHFKSVNDNHGHAVGDQVLQHVSGVLRGMVSPRDIVCRYGGEEFCVLLPGSDIEQAAEAAEAIRTGVAAEPCAGVAVTISLGLSWLTRETAEMRQLLEEADAALYVSKRAGRNRLTRSSDVTASLLAPEGDKHSQRNVYVDQQADVAIPFHAVAALSAALSFRDALTGEHSRRVADLCVNTARGLMSQRQCYVLEVAALLHDIGKLGVPDAILLKPGPLTGEEWKVMARHDRIGTEIIMAAFSSHELTEIVRTHHAFFGGQGRNPGLPQGTEIPLGARILTIADAYDAIVSDRVYRKGRCQADAFAELRRCAGTQFDPDIVEHFISAVMASSVSREPAMQAEISRQTALRVGLQIERLAEALDAQDYPSLAILADRLAAIARQEGIDAIAVSAEELSQAAATEPELLQILALSNDLLEVCRATQSARPAPCEEEDLSDDDRY
jgi:diguanylate cyclase (GGDEF)-like protein/PAS domain S-box-containing protein